MYRKVRRSQQTVRYGFWYFSPIDRFFIIAPVELRLHRGLLISGRNKRNPCGCITCRDFSVFVMTILIYFA